MKKLLYLCDKARHLICVPYGVENLHRMANELGIHRCWFHAGAKYAHYDIPKRLIAEITAKCIVVNVRQIVLIATEDQVRILDADEQAEQRNRMFGREGDCG